MTHRHLLPHALRPIACALTLTLAACAADPAAPAGTDEADLPLPALLKRLDDAIDHKAEAQRRRQQQADSLAQAVRQATGAERTALLYDLIDVYLHYQTDSTLSVIARVKTLPDYAADPRLQAHMALTEAQVYGMMGLYSTALDLMDRTPIDPADTLLRLHRCNARHSVLGWMGEYAQSVAPAEAPAIMRRAAAYHDTLAALEPDPLNRDIIWANKDYDRGDYAACVERLNRIMATCDEGQRIYVYSRLSEAHAHLGHPTEQVRYLTLTAICDIRSGITEYMALPQLAYLLHEAGDTGRAYRYLLCALEDATACKASLRTVETSKVFPIIERAQQETQRRERLYGYVLIGLLGLAAIALATVIGIQRRVNRKLHALRFLLAKRGDELAESNRQLRETYATLARTDRLKGEHLTSYLTRSRRYLASLESFRHTMLNLLRTRQLDEMQRQLDSTQLADDEQQRFLSDFDETFLSLYPGFVERFNAMLRPDCQIVPRRGELLNTELRIFALIRMGETDSSKIAKFLNYSITTIYNYRSRVRQGCLGDKETFEQRVMQL